jgi:pimeloyl-ACP methyl ester carboxylesterase
MNDVSYDEWIRQGDYENLTDGRVYFVKRGKGFPVFLMHFYGGESWWLSPVVDAFAKHFTTYVIDIPGCGLSDEPVLPYGPPQYADALTEFMNRQGIDRAHLVGVHGSGLNAIHLAATRPTRVGRIVLDGYPPWNSSEGRELFRDKFLGAWMDENQFMKSYEQVEWVGDPFPSLSGHEREVALERVKDGFLRHRQWIAGSIKQAMGYDGFLRLPLVQSPTLVVYGESDWSVKALGDGEAPIGRLLHGLTGARAEIIPNSGLVPSFEQPDEYIRVVLDEFLLKGFE